MKWYRVNINYLSKDCENCALETSSPAKSLKDGLEQYTAAVMFEKCSDLPNIPARVALVEYVMKKGERHATPKTIVSNTEQVEVLKMLAAK